MALAIYRNVATQPTNSTAENSWLSDILILVFYGLVLATMALIGQIYHLDGSIAALLLAWTLVTLPAVLLAKGNFVATLWFAATVFTYYLNLIELYDYIFETLGLDRQTAKTIALSIFLIGPLLFICLSRIPQLKEYRPNFAVEISHRSWFIIVVAGFFAQFLWYTDNMADEIPSLALLITGLATAVVVLLIPTLYRERNSDAHLAMRVILLSVYLLGFVACWHTSSLDIVGALSNLAYLCILAWAAIKIKSTALFNTVTAVIALRIMVIYFEVFGSMMQTGIGLIIGGLLTVLLAWLWFKKSSALASQLTSQ